MPSIARRYRLKLKLSEASVGPAVVESRATAGDDVTLLDGKNICAVTLSPVSPGKP